MIATAKRAPAKRDTKEAIRREQRAWIERLMEATGLPPSRLATEAGLSDTTLTRFLNAADHGGALSQVAMHRLSERHGFPLPGATAEPAAAPAGFRENEATLVSDWPDAAAEAAVRALIGARPNAFAWRIRTDALALAGIRPGDILIFDAAVPAGDGDIVIAQIEMGTGARTVCRIYQTPNLVGAGLDPTRVRPEQVDGQRVRIAGVMTDLIRSRS